MSPVRLVSDDERRARLAVRHALAPAFRVDSPAAATAAMTVLHATVAASVHLSCRARVSGLEIADVDDAFYRDRRLVKQLGMRRTLFVLPHDLLPAVWGSASARVADFERRAMAKDVVTAGVADDGGAWLDQARAEVLAVLADAPEGRSALEIRRAVPMISTTVAVSAGNPWSASRVLTHLGATADIVRAAPTGDWRAPRPRWTLTRHWFADVPSPWAAVDGYRELVRRWLHTFGPGTEDDIVWWLGATRTAVRAALGELDAVRVTLDRGGVGWLLPDDLDEVPDPGPWVALLPELDPTVMGWQGRGFYLGRHREQLFDRNGNAGTTVWVDGRIVGCWVQDHDAAIRVRLLEPVSGRAQGALDREAAELTAWLDGVRVPVVLPSPSMTVERLS